MHHFAFNYWNLGFIFKTAIHLRLEVHPLAPSLPLRLAGTEWRSDAKIHHSWTAWSWHMWQRWSGEFGWWFMQLKKTELHMDSNCSKMIGPEDYVIRAFCEPPSVPEWSIQRLPVHSCQTSHTWQCMTFTLWQGTNFTLNLWFGRDSSWTWNHNSIRSDHTNSVWTWQHGLWTILNWTPWYIKLSKLYIIRFTWHWTWWHYWL